MININININKYSPKVVFDDHLVLPWQAARAASTSAAASKAATAILTGSGEAAKYQDDPLNLYDLDSSMTYTQRSTHQNLHFLFIVPLKFVSQGLCCNNLKSHQTGERCLPWKSQ